MKETTLTCNNARLLLDINIKPMIGTDLNGRAVLIGASTGGALNVTESGGVGTYTFASLGASGSTTIPISAKSWTVSFLTGTGTIGGQTVSAGFSDSDDKQPTVAITITTAAASSAYIRYSTT